ncbi:MAG TPA: GTPase Era [Clostridiales bacterium]|nr:GTPase Era [Clostridiales bacterium]
MEFKCGYISIIGRPNVGKSTLINNMVGQKVSIVTWKPQTTRNRLLGIVNRENAQIILIDTPGIHQPKNQLGKYMQKAVNSAISGIDGILYVIDAEKPIVLEDEKMIERVLKEAPAIVLLNKIDRVDAEKIAEKIKYLGEKFPKIQAVIPIAAIKGKNIDMVFDEILKILPVGERHFDEDYYTDQSIRFLASEIIREKAFRVLEKEIPYGIAVIINSFKETKNIIHIDADIVVQKDSHKGIVLGKNGETIKKIGTYARQDLEEILGQKVFLKLFVKVREDWRDSRNFLRDFGYNSKDL